jgi:hypothetical protein
MAHTLPGFTSQCFCGRQQQQAGSASGMCSALLDEVYDPVSITKRNKESKQLARQATMNSSRNIMGGALTLMAEQTSQGVTCKG